VLGYSSYRNDPADIAHMCCMLRAPYRSAPLRATEIFLRQILLDSTIRYGMVGKKVRRNLESSCERAAECGGEVDLAKTVQIRLSGK
jgi:hypothetical protein